MSILIISVFKYILCIKLGHIQVNFLLCRFLYHLNAATAHVIIMKWNKYRTNNLNYLF